MKARLYRARLHWEPLYRLLAIAGDVSADFGDVAQLEPTTFGKDIKIVIPEDRSIPDPLAVLGKADAGSECGEL